MAGREALATSIALVDPGFAGTRHCLTNPEAAADGEKTYASGREEAAEKGMSSIEHCEGHTSGAEEAAEKLVISIESGEKARPRLKPVLILLALCGG
jgi:hypothetical protein